MNTLYELIVYIPLILFSITIHEVAHGWMADKLGDDTARFMGRLTLNPVAHIDLIGTIILPAIAIITGAPVFGWAKPVPVDPYRLNNPKRDMVFVGLAGPASNFLLAVIVSLLLIILKKTGVFLNEFFILQNLLVLNVILGVFNLIPVPPLDGSQILSGVLPPRLAYEYQKIAPYGVFIIMFLLLSGSLSLILWPIVALILNLLGVV
ncbi:MAG: site-2 protease family protein [Elusimicrobiota bacterium]